MKKGLRFVLISMNANATQSVDLQDALTLLVPETDKIQGQQLKIDVEDVTRHYRLQGYDKVMLHRVQAVNSKKLDSKDIYLVIYGLDFTDENAIFEQLKKIADDFASVFKGRLCKVYRNDDLSILSTQIKGYQGTHFDYLHRDIATTKEGRPEPTPTDTTLH